MSTRIGLPEFLAIPGAQSIGLHLPDEIAALREKALTLHAKGPVGTPVPEITLIDANSWAAHTEQEDWLIWRARRCAERLRHMPLELEPGERIVGRPRQRDLMEDEKPAQEQARQTLASMPPYPEGDAGHFHPDYDTLFRLGLGGLLKRVEMYRQQSEGDAARVTFYQACRISLEGMVVYIRRVAEACQAMSVHDPAGALRWQELAHICEHLTTEPPVTFHQALQLLFLTIIAMWFGEDHGLTSPGRLDQLLWPFYQADVAAGRLDAQQAVELLSCLFIQFNRILNTGSAISVMIGGRNAQGLDVTNELTCLCLATRLATGLSYPTVGLAWHRHIPTELMDFAVQMVAFGGGDPAFFNDEVIVKGLREHGVSDEDSYNYMNSTCVEIKVVGRSNMWVTAPYFNLPQALLEVMGAEARGEVAETASFADLEQRVRENLAGKVR
ncbi:MAG: pyruvate formate lyase family protein [Anaerolineae bacterium]